MIYRDCGIIFYSNSSLLRTLEEHRLGHDYSKLHLITAVGGRIATFAVTSGTTHDSSIFQKIWEMISDDT